MQFIGRIDSKSNPHSEVPGFLYTTTSVRYCVEYLYNPVTMRLELYLAVQGRVCVILCNPSLLINMRGGLLL
jgi:hypothetical protein